MKPGGRPWGPCPSPRLVDYNKEAAEFSLRLWSDNRLEIRNDGLKGCFSCSESFPPTEEWINLDPPEPPPNAQPVRVDETHVGVKLFLVAYSDGSVYQHQYSIEELRNCNGSPNTSHCDLLLDPNGWELMP